MRKVLFIKLICILIISSCTSTKPLNKEVSQKYYSLGFSPENLKKKTSNTEITITPIDAKSLNKETYDAALRDGNYEKEFVSIVENWKSKMSSYSKKEKNYIQGKINAIDYLSNLEKEGGIPPQISVLLKQRIIYENIGKDGSEIESLSDISISPSEFNPYKGNINYFSVFKVTFENKGNTIEKINLKDFQIVSNEEQLYPLASEYFEKNLGSKSETIKNSYRMNMPNELTLTPNQRINKYIAVPAINSENNKLQVQLIRNGKVENFDFTVSKNETEKKYKLNKYELIGSGDIKNLSKFYFVISYKNDIAYSLKDYQIFVSDEKKKIKATVYAIALNSSNTDISFGLLSDFYFTNEKTLENKVPFKRIKRDKSTGEFKD